jgi:hypothetical protein
MKKSFLFLLIFCFSCCSIATLFAAATPPSEIGFGGTWYPPGTIIDNWNVEIISVLSFVQGLLLKLMLPIVVIWGSLYIAYELFTAEWDETKMKKAWKSVVFTAIGLVCIAVSYAFVTILSTLSF